MAITEELERWTADRLQRLIDDSSEQRVVDALSRPERDLADLAALISPTALPYLEDMAREAQRLTRWHFGRTISLYIPIYLSNVCVADCVYCGYSVKSGNKEKRISLKPDEIRRECETLAGQGFQNVLLLTGEAPRAVPASYIAEAVSIAHEYFPSVSAEVYALDTPGYRELIERGLEGVVVYMETYDRETYGRVHLIGEKADYDFRLGALERAGDAGARKLSLGVLLGLDDWRMDALRLALHARHLQRRCWQASLSVSFPRLLHVPERYRIARPVSDRDFVQMMLAMRLFLPEAGFNLSTRESPRLRDRLMPLAVTSMSAGSSTRPGGYATTDDRYLEQFALEDHRSAAEVADAIRAAGYDPVWKDFDHAFDTEVAR